MATTKTYYMPKDDVGKARLLEHLSKHLPVHAAALGITENDINEVKADAAAFAYTLSALETVQSNGKLWTAFKNQQRDGGMARRRVAPHIRQRLLDGAVQRELDG